MIIASTLFLSWRLTWAQKLHGNNRRWCLCGSGLGEEMTALNSKDFWGISDVFVLSFLLLLFVPSVLSWKVPWFSLILFLSFPFFLEVFWSLLHCFCHFYGNNLERSTDHVSVNFCKTRYKSVNKLCQLKQGLWTNWKWQDFAIHTVSIIVNHVNGFQTFYDNKLYQNSFQITMIVNATYVTKKELQL